MKRNLTFSKLVMLVVMAILPLTFYAQEGKSKKPVEKYWYIFGEGGFSINHGDLANYTGWVFEDLDKDYFLKNFNGQIGVGYQFGGVIGLNGKFGTGSLSGYKKVQNLTIIDYPGYIPEGSPYGLTDLSIGNKDNDQRTTYIETNLNLTFNVFNLFNYNPRRVVNFIPHVGIGGVFYKAGMILDKEGEVLAEKKDDRASALTVPVGAEINFNVAPKLDIFVDYTYAFASKDDLDQVEKYPTDKVEVINDMYSQLNLGLRYKFNNPCDIEKMARESKEITMKVNPDPLTEKDGKVCFDVIVTIPEEYFEKQAVMNLTPYLSYNGGQINLDPITFVGEKVKGEGDFRVSYKNGGEFTKNYCIDYVPEIENSELMGNPMFYVYNGEIYPTQDEIVKNAYFTQGGERKLADGVIVTTKPAEPAPEPEPEPEPEPAPTPDFVYYYAKDSHAIRNNDVNKAARQALKEKMNAGEEVKGFRIEGWASPEGELDHNANLANDRANAAEKDMKAQLKKAKINTKDLEFNAKGNGPDWDTFITLVENSNIADKNAILNVIRNAGANREEEIKNMINVYPELEKDILPLLRRAEVYIF